jgi:uncharacterized protein (DUF1697 family)
MPRYVAFLRAVNVGGRFVKMESLRNALSDSGFSDIETHIQSGNVLVSTPMRAPDKVAGAVAEVLGERAGFDIPAIVRRPSDLTRLVEEVDAIPPLHEGPGETKRYLCFTSAAVPPEASAILEAWDRPGERARVLGPDVLAELSIAFHRVKLTNTRIEKITGLTATWRDLGVVRDIAQRWGSR